MIPKLSEIHPSNENPFEKCQLNRGQYAEILTDVIRQYNTGFVLALNNEWGTGKTTFVRMWQKQLENEDYVTILFNAWEHDYEKEPLVAILSALKSLFPKKKASFNELVKKGSKLFTSSLPVIGKALVKKYTGSDIGAEVVEKTIEAAEGLFEKEVDEYYKKQEHLVTFKKALSEYVSESDNEKPIIFFVDELDRCRPDYAVEILEHIKHFFSVNKIVFVLSVDKKQLGHSIQGYYGSNQIDSEAYLKRFIDLEYSIPMPDMTVFSKFLLAQFEIDLFFGHSDRQASEVRDDQKMFLEMSVLIANANHLSLRDLEKLYAQTAIVLKSFKTNQYVIPRLLFFLIFAKSYHSEFYRQLSAFKFSHQELIDEYENIIENLKMDRAQWRIHPFEHVEVLLIVYYNNSLMRGSIELYKWETNEEGKEVYSSSLKSKFLQDELGFWMKRIREDFHTSHMEVKSLIEKIDLSKPFFQ